MRTLSELQHRLSGYTGVHYLYYPNIGYIAWHYSTGDNIEVLFLEATLGYGAVMYSRMVRELQRRGERPYHSLFAYRLTSNDNAGRFYSSFGWTQVDLGQSIYRDDGTTLVWITWDKLIAFLDKYYLLDR